MRYISTCILLVLIGLIFTVSPEACLRTLILALGVELACVLYYRITDGAFYSVSTKLWRDVPNAYLAEGTDRFTLFDRFMDHPYLGHINHNNPPAGRPFFTGGAMVANQRGFIGPDFPAQKNPEEFAIYLSGGSVAERYASSFIVEEISIPPLLEEHLNDMYLPPDGKKRFRVYNAAVGGWKQPQQTIFLTLFWHLMDGFICLEGYNELMTSKLAVEEKGVLFEYPWINMLVPRNSFKVTMLLRSIRLAYWWLKRDVLLSRLKSAYALTALFKCCAEQMIEKTNQKNANQPTTFESVFKLNGNLDGDRFVWAMDRYCSYVRTMQTLTLANHIRFSFFLQPCAGIGKKLTDEEKSKCTRHGYEEQYLFMEKRLLALRAEGVPVASLLDVFEGINESVFIDDAHINPPLAAVGRGLGHELVTARIGAAIAQEWGLEPRKVPGRRE